MLTNNGSGTLTWSAPTATDSTKVLKAGDTMSGALTLPLNGLVAGTNQLVLSSGNVGIASASPTTTLDVNVYDQIRSDFKLFCNDRFLDR